jgi:hypothetical protein
MIRGRKTNNGTAIASLRARLAKPTGTKTCTCPTSSTSPSRAGVWLNLTGSGVVHEGVVGTGTLLAPATIGGGTGSGRPDVRPVVVASGGGGSGRRAPTGAGPEEGVGKAVVGNGEGGGVVRAERGGGGGPAAVLPGFLPVGTGGGPSKSRRQWVQRDPSWKFRFWQKGQRRTLLLAYHESQSKNSALSDR